MVGEGGTELVWMRRLGGGGGERLRKWTCLTGHHLTTLGDSLVWVWCLVVDVW